MSENESNPYAPPAKPAKVNESAQNIAPLSLIAIAAVGIAALSYSGFTINWLSSRGPDATAGKMFLFNLPVFALWIYSLLCLRKFAFIAGLSAVFVQAAIMTYMLYTEFSDTKTVVSINGAIIAVLLVLVWLSHRSKRKRVQADE